MIENFTTLLAIANHTGTVTTAMMYDNGFISIEGKTKDGKTFAITMSVKEEETNGN